MTTDNHEPASTNREADGRIDGRADLLPEEAAAGTSDATAQATEILRESDERVEQAETDARTGAEPIERRDSAETA